MSPGPRWNGRAIVLTMICLLVLVPAAGRAAPALARLASQAISADRAVSAPAIEQLRAAGPDGLAALIAANKAAIETHTADPAAADSTDPRWQRLSAALDAVGQQCDCATSGLYWYTDLAQAERAARATGRPILSLRLLGRLNEEMSCANSRFFRTALYANAGVSEYLRGHFVLHWKSVRPVPRVTIDFGNGRKLVRTVTGNSIHYVLNADGAPIDALPGLYGPQAFLEALKPAEEAARQSVHIPAPALAEFVQRYHSVRLAAAMAAYQADSAGPPQARAAGATFALVFPAGTAPIKDSHQFPAFGAPNAVQVMPRAVSKAAVETPIARNVLPLAAVPPTDARWIALAGRHTGDARLDPRSIALICRKSDCSPAGATGRARRDRLVAAFERSLAQDTVYDEYDLHAQIHRWFAAGTAPADLDALNEKVYAQIFQTPNSDPWLGLAPDDVYSALPHDGLIR